MINIFSEEQVLCYTRNTPLFMNQNSNTRPIGSYAPEGEYLTLLKNLQKVCIRKNIGNIL